MWEKEGVDRMSLGLVVYINGTSIFYTWEQFGISEQEFDELPRDVQEKIAWDKITENLNWGFYKRKE